LRVMTHDDLVTAEGDHRRRRLGLQRHEAADVLELRAEVLDDLLGRRCLSAGAVQDQVEPLLLDAATDLHERMHVVTDDERVRAALAAEPAARVADDRVAGERVQALEVLQADAVEVGAAGLGALGELAQDIAPARQEAAFAWFVPATENVLGSQTAPEAWRMTSYVSASLYAYSADSRWLSESCSRRSIVERSL